MGYIVIALAALLAFNGEKAKEYDIENVTVFTYAPFLNYDFTSDDGTNLKLAPTSSQIAGLSVKQKSFTYAFGYQQKNKNRSDSQRTNFFDIQVATDFDKILATAYYQNYQGFYVNDNGIININKQLAISSVTYGLNLRYFTKEDYDLGSSILSDKKDRKSDYSTFHSVYANSTKFNNDSELFQKDGLETLSGLRQMNVVNFGYEYGISGTYNFLWMRITGLLSIGYNLHNIHLEKDETINEVNASYSTSAFIDLGLLDLESTSVGVYAKTVNMKFEHEDIAIDQTRASATLYLRYFF